MQAIDWNFKLHKEKEQKHCRKVNKKKIINYINWENSLESNMPKKIS